MSHFSILVVGDVDYNMAPFHEYECDGINDEFIEDIDKTEYLRKEYEKRKDEEDIKGKSFLEFVKYWEGDRPVLKSVDEINTNLDEQKWGYILVDENNEVVKVIRRTNPNSFYDYYTDGRKAFLLKQRGANGEKVWMNHARKCEIDFEGMFEEKIRKAKEAYRMALNLLGYEGDNYPTIEHTWASLVDKFHPEEGEPTLTRDEADAIYRNQEIVKKWDTIDNRTKIENFGIWTNVDEFCMSEEDYIRSQSIHALSFGFVRNRQYCSNGDMGWWAMVANEKEPTSWDKEYEDFLNSISYASELTMLDCHV